MGNNDSIMILLGLGALYLLSGGRPAPITPTGIPQAWQGLTFPSQAPIINLHVEGVEGSPERPEPANRLTTVKRNGKVYHSGYTKAEMAWRRAQPARSISRGGGGKSRR